MSNERFDDRGLSAPILHATHATTLSALIFGLFGRLEAARQAWRERRGG